ncbi:hypothetical protein LMG22037_00455 [Paraburkholderia phenoliruptrix]|uniref:Lipoprotein n=1 Tax=Paraburkholderia phenoliruptrix TaxID=252970 RepID=A0A6J4ZYU5_9BURK|nr:hypothetical protein [Paraburkholderia phenoliruptrix]CAB3642901.1 hypothetical protein LMG22037_00455 [Paraburkholderia phenoliruptrix]
MSDTSRPNHAMPLAIRQATLVAAMAVLLSLQGCATSLETFGLGAGVGIVGAFSLLGCAIGCH